MERMRDVLRGSLARSLRELPDEDRLAAAWPVACGPALASHGEVLYLDAEATLHIRVIGREWFQQFMDIRSALTADLARIAAVKLHALHFEEKGSVRLWPRNPSKCKEQP